MDAPLERELRSLGVDPASLSVDEVRVLERRLYVGNARRRLDAVPAHPDRLDGPSRTDAGLAPSMPTTRVRAVDDVVARTRAATKDSTDPQVLAAFLPRY